MNSKDLCLVEHLEELKDAGIVSFKIEGRAKSVYYVGNTVKVYKEIMDHGTLNMEQPLKELKKAQNRGFTKGFLFGKEECEQKIDKCHEECGWEFCGVVLQDALQDFTRSLNLMKVKVHNKIVVGDEIELVIPNAENISFKVEKMYNQEGEEITEAHGGQEKVIYLPIGKDIAEHSLIRRKL